MPVKLTPLLIHRAPMIKNSGLDPIAAANLAPVSAQNPAQTAAGSDLRKNLEKVTQAPRSGAAAPGSRATTAAICAPIVRQEDDSPFIDPNFRDFICRLDSVQQVQVIEDKAKETDGLFTIVHHARWLKPAAYGVFITLLWSESDRYEAVLMHLYFFLHTLTKEQQELAALQAFNRGDFISITTLISRAETHPELRGLALRYLPRVHKSCSADILKKLIERTQESNMVSPSGDWKNKLLAVLVPSITEARPQP